ncbi:MAG: thioredoxin [Candidatus Omnitrophota bacterium]
MAAIHFKADQFEQDVLKSDIPVLIDFYAEWCGPCKMLAPIVDELSDELEGKVKVGKINVDDAQELAGKYGVASIPNLLLFKNGEVVDQMVGAMPKDQLLERVKANL